MPADRVASVYPLDGGAGEHLVIPADVVFCDICGVAIAIRPVPVTGSYALCPTCFQRAYGMTVEEAARKDGIDLRKETT
jgi:hypothetical protein